MYQVYSPGRVQQHTSDETWPQSYCITGDYRYSYKVRKFKHNYIAIIIKLASLLLLTAYYEYVITGTWYSLYFIVYVYILVLYKLEELITRVLSTARFGGTALRDNASDVTSAIHFPRTPCVARHSSVCRRAPR